MQLVTLGTGERLKRTTIPDTAPLKPARHPTPGHSPCGTPHVERKSGDADESDKVVVETDTRAETQAEADEADLMYMNLNAEGEVDSAEGELDEPAWEGEEGTREEMSPPRELAKDRRTSRRARRDQEKQKKDREKRETRERKQRERREEKERKLKEKSKSPPPSDPNSPALPPKDVTTAKLTNGAGKEGEDYDEDALKASEVRVTKHPNEISTCCQPIDVVFNTASAGEGSLTAVCKGTKVAAVETSVTEESDGQYRVQFAPKEPDVFMLSVKWQGYDVPGSPFLINLNLLPPAHSSADDDDEPDNKDAAARQNVTESQREGGEGKEEGRENEGGASGTRHGSREIREESPAVVVSDEDPFDMAYAASRILGKFVTLQTVASLTNAMISLVFYCALSYVVCTV